MDVKNKMQGQGRWKWHSSGGEKMATFADEFDASDDLLFSEALDRYESEACKKMLLNNYRM